ncbi:UNVERIFIED_ORG: hypothetical protein LHJ69_10555 [Shinella sp. XGS7]|nr:hypothetical protein [Shinella sp. XGS7]
MSELTRLAGASPLDKGSGLCELAETNTDTTAVLVVALQPAYCNCNQKPAANECKQFPILVGFQQFFPSRDADAIFEEPC